MHKDKGLNGGKSDSSSDGYLYESFNDNSEVFL
jgi:hypothetical protein